MLRLPIPSTPADLPSRTALQGARETNRERPGLQQALAACRAGDTLGVTKHDRLARSLPDARAIADELTQREVKLNLGGSVHDPTDPVGRLLFNALAMVAEFESDLIRMRTREGIKVAKAKGRLRGKQPKLSPTQEAHLVKLYRSGEHTISELEELVPHHSLDDLPGSRAGRRTHRARASWRPGTVGRGPRPQPTLGHTYSTSVWPCGDDSTTSVTRACLTRSRRSATHVRTLLCPWGHEPKHGAVPGRGAARRLASQVRRSSSTGGLGRSRGELAARRVTSTSAT